MDNHGLDLHATMLLDDYHQELPLYKQLCQIVVEQIGQMLKDSGIEVSSLGSRIKTEASFIGKLQRKASKYHSLSDITDIFGVRVVAYYNEDVDRIASMAENLFEVDWANSVDKRKMQQFRL